MSIRLLTPAANVLVMSSTRFGSSSPRLARDQNRRHDLAAHPGETRF
jgi:hypothetical protein